MWYRKLGAYTAFLLGLSLMGGCALQPCGNDKDDFLARYAKLLADTQGKALPASDAGWKAHDEQFRRALDECYDLYEPEMSGREKRRFWMDATRYYLHRYGKGGGLEATKQAVELSKLIRRKSKAVGKEVEGRLDEWGKGLEKWSKGVEEWLEDVD